MRFVSETVDPGNIYALYAGEFKAQITRIALEIDIFSPLARGPTKLASMALLQTLRRSWFVIDRPMPVTGC